MKQPFRGPLVFREPLTVGRASDSQRAPDTQKALIFRGPLTVGRAPDDQTSP